MLEGYVACSLPSAVHMQHATGRPTVASVLVMHHCAVQAASSSPLLVDANKSPSLRTAFHRKRQSRDAISILRLRTSFAPPALGIQPSVHPRVLTSRFPSYLPRRLKNPQRLVRRALLLHFEDRLGEDLVVRQYQIAGGADL